MRAFVHLSNVWGDPDDSLALHQDFHEIVSQLRGEGESVLVAVSTEERSLIACDYWRAHPEVLITTFDNTDWADSKISQVAVDCRGANHEILMHLDGTLRAVGFRRAGRPWGEAGQSRRYHRTASKRDSLEALTAQAKVQVGAAVVNIRDGWLSQDRRSAWRNRARVQLSRSLSAADVLDQDFGADLLPVPIMNVNELVPLGWGVDRPAWSVDRQSEPAPLLTAQACFDQHGVWPISFSYPREPLSINPEPTDLIAPSVPGLPYAFEDEATYLAAYHRAYLGLTHRKAGWDCFRHVEILASGAVPWMPDAFDIPEFSMVHYPKRALRHAAEAIAATGGPPDSSTRELFREHFTQHLTSRAMGRYMLQASGLADSGSILFIDAALPRHADYLSVLTLIGLKQLLGTNCHVLHPVNYIYADNPAETLTLYGRGFGYSRVLDGQFRSVSELSNGEVEASKFDALIIGSVSRNWREANDWLRRFPPERTIWIHGEDTPPTIDQAHALRTSGTHTFVRAIHTGRR